MLRKTMRINTKGKFRLLGIEKVSLVLGYCQPYISFSFSFYKMTGKCNFIWDL